MNQMAKSLCLLIALALTSLRASAVATCDANGDGEINIADVSYIIDVILNGQSAAAAACDANGDGEVNIADVSTVIDAILSGAVVEPVYDGPLVGGDISMLTKYEDHQRKALQYGISNAHYYDLNGQRIDDVIPRLNGIRCGTKGTSCPDQLCRALEELKKAPIEG